MPDRVQVQGSERACFACGAEPLNQWCGQCGADINRATPERDRYRKTLATVVRALDDAIAHNVNATHHDPAGWTQEDYDAWDAARAKGEEVLNG